MATKRSYSAKAARKGKDIGKPGKNFSKIATKAGKKYGSKAAGKRVAGQFSLSSARRRNELANSTERQVVPTANFIRMAREDELGDLGVQCGTLADCFGRC